MDEEGNMGYYLYNEATGEEKLFSVVEEEREFARGAVEPRAFKNFIKNDNTAKLLKDYNNMKTSLANAKKDLVNTYKTKYADKVSGFKKSADNYMNSYIDTMGHVNKAGVKGANIILNAKEDLSRIAKNLNTGKYKK